MIQRTKSNQIYTGHVCSKARNGPFKLACLSIVKIVTKLPAFVSNLSDYPHFVRCLLPGMSKPNKPELAGQAAGEREVPLETKIKQQVGMTNSHVSGNAD
jgi:hypothetical protein